MKRLAASTLMALLGCSSGLPLPEDVRKDIEAGRLKPATHEQAEVAMKLPHLRGRLEKLKLKYLAMDNMLSRLEALESTNPELVEKYYSAFKRLYLKAAEGADKERINDANAVLDFFMGKGAEPQTAYVICDSGFAERNNLQAPKTKGEVEKELKRRGIFGKVEGSREKVNSHLVCKLCGSTDNFKYQSGAPTSCPKNAYLERTNTYIGWPGNWVYVVKLGPHKTESVVDSKTLLVRVDGREYASQSLFAQGELVIGSAGQLYRFPSEERAKRVQALLSELR